MIDYKTMYETLYTGITGTVELLMRCENIQAIEGLVALQQRTEALFVNQREEPCQMLEFKKHAS